MSEDDDKGGCPPEMPEKARERFGAGFFDSLKWSPGPKLRIVAVELPPVVYPFQEAMLARVDKLIARLDGQSKPVESNQPTAKEKGKPGRRREEWINNLVEFCETLKPHAYSAFLEAVKEGKVERIREAKWFDGVVRVLGNDGSEDTCEKKEINRALRDRGRKPLV